jgi:glycosyltransferase involved in cell wall biosynthesis
MHARLRVLQLGPLYTNHVRRWSRHAVTMGCAVHAAGHVKPGRQRRDFSRVAETLHVAPGPVYEMGAEAHVSWLRSVLDQVQPDLVQAHSLLRWPYYASLAGCRPLIVTPTGSDLYLATGEARRRADHAILNADVVIARSAHMRRELLMRGVPADRIERADLGVDLERFSPAPEPADPGPPVILSFRAGAELYNLDVVLDAFHIVRGRLPSATLVLITSDVPVAEWVQSRFDELADAAFVHIPGHVGHAQMARYMRRATVGVSVPRSDGSPNSVWEALATGLPLVLSNLPQVVERVGDSGAAVFVEPRAEAVATALIDVLEQPERRRRMASAARTWAESNADERRQVARLSAIYARFASRDIAPAAARTPPPS